MRFIIQLVLGLALASGGVMDCARAQNAVVYVASYVELVPSSAADGVALLKASGAAIRKEDGNLRAEIIQETSRPNRFIILGAWKDQKTFEAHGNVTTTAQFRDKLKAIEASPIDERVNSGLAVGPIELPRAGSAVYVVTHVDVIPPRKDEAVAILQQLAEDSRKDAGNLRFEIGQQTSRANHFTVLEIWQDQGALDDHVAAAHTRAFRAKLSPMAGSLYDERLYKVLQ
jgi:quinol monooxygenase YgiN